MDSFDLPNWLRENYGFPVLPSVSLLRSYVNDVYLVAVHDEKFVLKVYRRNWRSESEVKYEVELLEYLDSKGLLVAKAITAKCGKDVKTIDARPVRLAVLYEYAPGIKPQPPFSANLYYFFGEAIGNMHELTSSFISQNTRRNIDLNYLIDDPLTVLEPLLRDRPAEWEFLVGLSETIKGRIENLNENGLDWGPIHGDATLDNLHVVEGNGILLYDFDSGGPGWRASDLQGWAVGMAEYQEKYRSFMAGYSSAREVKTHDVEASPFVNIAWDIWELRVELEIRVGKLGENATRRYLGEQMQWIKYKAERLT